MDNEFAFELEGKEEKIYATNLIKVQEKEEYNKVEYNKGLY